MSLITTVIGRGIIQIQKVGTIARTWISMEHCLNSENMRVVSTLESPYSWGSGFEISQFYWQH